MPNIKVPGDLPDDGYGQMYYAITKTGTLAMVGEHAKPGIMRLYRLNLTDAEIELHGLSGLPQEASK